MFSHGPVARRLDGAALHQPRKPWQSNWEPRSHTMYLGALPALRMARPKKARTACEVGCSLSTVQPIVRREKWSTTTASQKQKGRRCGRANGSRETDGVELAGSN